MAYSSSYSGIPLYQDVWDNKFQTPSIVAPNMATSWGPRREPTQAGLLANNIMGGANQLMSMGGPGGDTGISQYTSWNTAMANQLAGLGKGLAGAFKGNLGWANKALQTAFDPNKAYYKQARQDLIEGERSGQAARGIAMTPYGASVEANALGRFGNEWQDRQVGRQNLGAQTATGLQNQYAQGVLGGGQLMGMGANINQNNIAAMLQQYGLKGDNLAKALGIMTQLFGNMGQSQSQHIS